MADTVMAAPPESRNLARTASWADVRTLGSRRAHRALAAVLAFAWRSLRGIPWAAARRLSFEYRLARYVAHADLISALSWVLYSPMSRAISAGDVILCFDIFTPSIRCRPRTSTTHGGGWPVCELRLVVQVERVLRAAVGIPSQALELAPT